MSELYFVFLQGMPSAFFSRIAAGLTALGCRTTGINVCVGDALFWRGQNTVNYRGTLKHWPAFLADYFTKNHVSDLVLLGEQRHYHKQAVEVAKQCGVRVTVTDFGYLRPDWITLEKDGMSGNSKFPRDPQEIIKLAALAPRVDTNAHYADKFWTMAKGDLLYSFSNVFFGWLYPFYRRSDNRLHPLLYFPAIGLRLLFAGLRRKHTQKTIASLHSAKTNFFLFPLQLEHDFQIVAYSPFGNMLEPIRMVLTSFARHAPKTTCLLIKVHPWDPGLKNWKHRIAKYASELGIADRVECIDGGTIDEAIAHSQGMITVNSTSGLRAIELGYPVKTLGQAIYDIPGLTHQGTLDDFWTGGRPADRALVQAFMKALAATIQIRGVFFNEPGLTVAVKAAVERLYNGTVGQALKLSGS